MNPVKSEDRFIYFGFLVLIAWLPLPLGSNRPWAEAIVEVWACSLMFLWLIAIMRNKVQTTDVFKKAAPAVGLFFYMVYLDIAGYCCKLSLSPAWIASISPVAFGYHRLVNAKDIMTLSLDPYTTVDFNLQIPANAATFMLILSMAWISYGFRNKVDKKRK